MLIILMQAGTGSNNTEREKAMCGHERGIVQYITTVNN